MWFGEARLARTLAPPITYAILLHVTVKCCIPFT
jgi:hypothetical protein